MLFIHLDLYFCNTSYYGDVSFWSRVVFCFDGCGDIQWQGLFWVCTIIEKKKKEEWNWLHIHYAATTPQTTPCNHFLFSFRVSLFELTDCDSTAGWWIVTKTFRWVCEPLVRHIYNYPAPSSLVFNLQGPAAKHTRRTSLYKSRPVFLHYLVERQKVCH